MKGKIAVITGCHQCPYKAFDSTMGIIREENGNVTQHNSEVVYCGYHKIGYDGTQENLDKIINWETHIFDFKPKNKDDAYPSMPENCPLPDGEDGRC